MEVAEALLKGPLAQVLAIAMARDPDARYDHCDAFADALRGLSLEGFAALERGAPRVLLTSVNPPPEETADVDGERVELRAGELASTTPFDGPSRAVDAEPARTEALDSRELFSVAGQLVTEPGPVAVVPGPDGADPWEGETLAMEMPAHVVAEYDARVAADRAGKEPEPKPGRADTSASAGAFGLLLAVGAAVLALIILVAVVLGVIFLLASGDDAPQEEPVTVIDIADLAAPPEGGVPEGNVADGPSNAPVAEPDVGVPPSDAVGDEPAPGESGDGAGTEDGSPEVADAGAVPGADAAPDVDAAAAGAATAVDVTLASTPVGATVYGPNRAKLGYTPLALRVPVKGVELTFKARGYHSRKVRVRAADAPRFSVSLKKKKASSNTGIGIAQ